MESAQTSDARQWLAEYYGRLSDDELRTLFESGDLTPLARDMAASELRHRGLRIVEPREEELGKEQDAPDELASRDGGTLILLTQLASPIEAELLRGRLRSEGIEARIIDAQMLRPLGGGGRILVPESQFDRARDILREIQRKSSGSRPTHRSFAYGGSIGLLILAAGILAAVLLFGQQHRSLIPASGRFNWGFGPRWYCINPGLDPICVERPPAN